MIYTITYDTAIEKRFYGSIEEELNFHLSATSYSISGSGIKTSIYLKYYGIESKAIALSSFKHASFIKEEMAKRDIPLLLIETGIPPKYKYTYINEKEEIIKTEEESMQMEDNNMHILNRFCEEECEDHSTFVLSYKDIGIKETTMYKHLETIKKKAEYLIVSLHPKYYEVLAKNKVNIMVLDYQDMLTYLDMDTCPLSKCKEIIEKELLGLSNIIIFAYSSKDFLVFMEGKVYHVVCLYKNISDKVIKESIFTGIVYSLKADSDFFTFCKECMVLSVGSAVSEGLYMPKDDLLDMLRTQIHVYQI